MFGLVLWYMHCSRFGVELGPRLGLKIWHWLVLGGGLDLGLWVGVKIGLS
jgi:hypothetical protein